MPPKPPPPLTSAQESLIAQFSQLFTLPPARATEIARNPKQSAVLSELVSSIEGGEAGKNDKLGEGKWSEDQGKLMVVLVGQGGKLDGKGRMKVTEGIADGKLASSDQVIAAVKYLESHPDTFEQAEFDKFCGVGVNISESDIPTMISSVLSDMKPAGWEDLGKALGLTKTTDLKWAAPLPVKTALESAFESLFGSKEAAREKKANAPKPTKAPKTPAAASSSAAPAVEEDPAKVMFESGWLSRLHKPGENPQINEKLKAEHLKTTGGKVLTRFPPEPNGYLHIGHSKAITVNFGYAAHHGGHTYLRYDDTNPQAEEAAYFESILEMVRWLGFEPWTITYSSDHFQRLFDLGVELVKKDKAYVCHCSAEEQFHHRGGATSQARTACSHRSRPISESLAEFERMRLGHYKKGEATLRMKMNLESGNPQMWDLVAYRIVEAEHHRTGAEWKIYPTYDFTHCLVDSFENISHSLCTTEFINSRESYDWLCDALEIYKPRQSEYGRLNIQGTVMSKRKIKKLVDDKHVSGWDDPRIYTLIALRRRGIPPGAIISFIQSLGVSTASSNIQLVKFEASIRAYLESSAPRLMLILQPLKVTIENVSEDYRVLCEKPLHPKIPSFGVAQIALTKTVYIDRDDFREVDSKDYFRLAPGKTVGLFSAPHPVTCTEVKKDGEGNVVEVIVKLETEMTKKPKAYIQWIPLDPQTSSPTCISETRIFNPLFNSDDPAALDDYLTDINPNSLELHSSAMIEPAFWSLAKQSILDARKSASERTKKALEGAKKDGEHSMAEGSGGKEDDTPVATAEQLVGMECVRFQGLRVGYFTVDKDSVLACLDEPEGKEPGWREGDKLVLNRIVSLKEDTTKKTVG